MNIIHKELGEPDINLAELSIWIHGRQFPDATDYWDANWLNVTAHCGQNNSNVTVNGNIIHLSELSQFLSGLIKLDKTLKGKAELSCMAPNLSVELEAKNHGQINLAANITPDHIYEKHFFLFEIDQSYLAKSIAELKSILDKYPIIGKP